MTRRPVAATLLLLATMLGVVVPVAAKELGEARLDAPISIDAEPGSTITVGWTVSTMVDGEAQPIVGSPVFIRLTEDGGPGSIAFGTETPAWSGHYVADVVVPDGGISIVEIGLRGESCENGVCQTSDMTFHLTGDVLVGAAAAPGAVGAGAEDAGADPAAPTIVADAATASTAAAPGNPWLVVGLIGLVALGLAVLAVVLRGRRPPTTSTTLPSGQPRT